MWSRVVATLAVRAFDVVGITVGVTDQYIEQPVIIWDKRYVEAVVLNVVGVKIFD
ncbi:hypothetical protein [Snodgrassella gandavensis]|uniref:hypothetical protein n=1 Tax=Snodgrassella gandavensis TaxID=2946698 RepID=UPI001EF6CD4D|nr:hypothetical protein [Snodgrassella gandavensis]